MRKNEGKTNPVGSTRGKSGKRDAGAITVRDVGAKRDAGTNMAHVAGAKHDAGTNIVRGTGAKRADAATGAGAGTGAGDASAAAMEIIAIFTESGVILDTGAAESKQTYVNNALLEYFYSSPRLALLYFGFEDKSPLMSQSLTFLHGILSFFLEKASKNPDLEITRSAAPLTADEANALLLKIPYATGSEYVDMQWLINFWGDLTHEFETELSAFNGSAAQFLLAHNSQINVVGRVFFHLVENKSGDYPFAFLATYSRKSSAAGGPPNKSIAGSKAEHVPLKSALLEYKGNQEMLLQLLSAVSKAADASDFISSLVESGELFSPLRFTTEEAYTFLKEIPLYEECGIMCRIPDWWKRRQNAIKVSLSIGEKPPSEVGLEALLSFKPSLVFDGVEMSRDELELLMAQTAGLSLLKGKWIEVDHDKLREALEAFDSAAALTGGMTLADAMRMQMGLVSGGSGAGLTDSDLVVVTNGQWLSGMMDNIMARGKREKIALGGGFKAMLRQYQQDGLDWLATMKNIGFGALLADDMGLGKTVQMLALLEHLRETGGIKALLIVPASLIGNWRAEIDRFAPNLRYNVIHTAYTVNPDNVENADLHITTYGMAARIAWLKEHAWDLLIVDEAQAIKNPGTKQTKAVKSIPAGHRIAMTGTPVENRLSDLWSIFDYLNAGLLGTAKEFSTYSKAMQNNESYEKLRRVISPFIMRRLKTDKSIISDLPDKVEAKAYAPLTKKQAVLYSAVVKDLEKTLVEAEGIERKGLILASIVRFKQICNHPDHFMGLPVFDSTHSGKFQLLSEICETIAEKRERVLVFTQFREMCGPLSDYLETLFHKKGLVLHGGTPVKKRAELVGAFNSERQYMPYMVLSLKAGGVGLNLTAANHVVHFDRWWNPAVENQATDRAFRIGQKKNVLVHKFITSGTVEEKIDKMIEDKLRLSGELIGSGVSGGENWITEMSSAELLDLFKLEA